MLINLPTTLLLCLIIVHRKVRSGASSSEADLVTTFQHEFALFQMYAPIIRVISLEQSGLTELPEQFFDVFVNLKVQYN